MVSRTLVDLNDLGLADLARKENYSPAPPADFTSAELSSRPQRPPDTEDYVFVLTAFEDLGIALFGQPWLQPPPSLSRTRTLADLGKPSQFEMTMLRQGLSEGLKRLVTFACATGELRTVLFPLEGGGPIRLEAARFWHVTRSLPRLVAGMLNQAEPFGEAAMPSPTNNLSAWGFVFVERRDVKRLVGAGYGQPLKIQSGTPGKPNVAIEVVAVGYGLMRAGKLPLPSPNKVGFNKSALARSLIQAYESSGGYKVITEKSLKASTHFTAFISDLKAWHEARNP